MLDGFLYFSLIGFFFLFYYRSEFLSLLLENAICSSKIYNYFSLVVLFGVFFSLLYHATLLNFGYKDFHDISFLFDANDVFADLIKYSMSFMKPLGLNVPDEVVSLWPSLFQNFYYHNPYGGVDVILKGGIPHFAISPVAELYGILNAYLIYFFGPSLIVGAYVVAFFIAMFFLVLFLSRKILINKNSALLLFVAVVLSYPSLFMITRGHFYSFITVFLMGVAVYCIVKRKYNSSIFFVSIVILLRPNFVFMLPFLFSLLDYSWKHLAAYSTKTFLMVFLVYSISYYFTQLIYPDYSISLAYEALNVYVEMYMNGMMGLAFGSSINGAVYAIYKIYGFSDTIMYFLLMVLVFIVAVVHVKKMVSAFESFYLSIVLYYIFTSVVGDYQLLLFLVPIFLFPWLRDKGREEDYHLILVVFFAVALLMIPKNFDYVVSLGAFSQVIINPLIMIFSTSLILSRVLKRGRQ